MIVVTGATGYIGSRIISQLMKASTILVVSRDAIAAARLFPDAIVTDYDHLAEFDLQGAMFIHLAARNNDQQGSFEEFREANADKLIQVARLAKSAGAGRFVNVCSTHALSPRLTDAYGLTKREGAVALAGFWPEGATNLYIPAAYAESFRGRLAALNRLPAAARSVAITVLRQVKPVISIDVLADVLLELCKEKERTSDPWQTEHYAADPVSDRGIFAMVKRLIDLSAAAAVLVLLGWLMVAVAIYVRLDSKGPAIFAQRRIGLNGKQFTCYKFRSMRVGTAHTATHNVSVSAVTKAGAILRRTKLDELPQIFNVFRNQMSLVGPRPCLPSQTELIEKRSERGVLQLKPGITGLAQIEDIDMSDPARLAAWDDRYGTFRTLLGDLRILLRTVLGSGLGDRIVKP